MITIKTFAFNLLQENTYVVSDETLECVIIDCGAYYDDERKALTEYISNEGLKPRHLLATHGHWDHNLGIDLLVNMMTEHTYSTKLWQQGRMQVDYAVFVNFKNITGKDSKTAGFYNCLGAVFLAGLKHCV